MLRKILGTALLIGVLSALLIAPAAAQQRRAVDRVERNGVMYTVYEEKRPNDPNTYLYYVEDGALGGGGGRSNLQFYKRQSGMESAAFIAATLLFAAAVLAIYRRSNLLTLLHR